ncbi:MAG: DUF481 domain-containing protein [Burkholderiaceae bacterium]
MKTHHAGALLLAIGLATGPVRAEWTGEAGFGLVSASGNTDSRSVSGTLALAREAGRYENHLNADIHRASTDGEESADRRAVGYKLDLKFDTRLYGWVSLRWENDQFANIDSRATLGSGIGVKLLTGPIHELAVEAGVGSHKTTYIDATPQDRGAVGIFALAYTGRLNENLTLRQRIGVEAGGDNTAVTSNTGVKVKMTKAFSLGISHLIKHNTDIVGALGKKRDSLTTVNLVYSF